MCFGIFAKPFSNCSGVDLVCAPWLLCFVCLHGCFFSIFLFRRDCSSPSVVTLPPPQFQESRLENVTFVNCVFTNADNAATAFTSVQMTNVSFAGGRFRSANGKPIVFNKLGTFAAEETRTVCVQGSLQAHSDDVRFGIPFDVKAGADWTHVTLLSARTSRRPLFWRFFLPLAAFLCYRTVFLLY